MSIQQHSRNFNGERMVARTYDSIDSITQRVQNNVADQHACIVLEERFWRALQEELLTVVGAKRRMLAAGGYTEAAWELRTVEDLAIRMAVEEFRGEALDDPYLIHDEQAWDEFRVAIREQAEACSFR